MQLLIKMDGLLYFLAVRFGHIEIVKALIEKGALLEAPNRDGYTPLFPAAEFNHLPVLRYLVEHGANINCKRMEYGLLF